MKNCSYCGSEMNDNAEFCPCCGANVTVNANADTATATEAAPTAQATVAVEEKHTGIVVVSFLLSMFISPVIALIMWLVWKDSNPAKSMAAAKGGLMVMSFSIPIVGLVAFILMKDKYRDVAKACGICGIIGVVFWVLIMVLYIGLFALMIAAGAI